MWPFPINWETIKDKEGDSVNISLTPTQRALVIGAIMNVQYFGEKSPKTMQIGEDSDNFDAVTSDLLSKLAGA